MQGYMVPNIKLLLMAMAMANRYHKGQKRKVSGDPYVYHVFTVMFIVNAFKRSKYLTEILCAAILHDSLEDTKLTFEMIARTYGPMVASIVEELTNDEEEIKRIGKLAYHKQKLLGISSYALIIKLADRLHNISDNPSAKMVLETLELMEHLKKNRKLTKSQSELVGEIIRLCKAKQ